MRIRSRKAFAAAIGLTALSALAAQTQASATVLPPVGTLVHASASQWSNVFYDDFTTAVPLGGWPGPAYASRWTGYSGVRDTSGNGVYDPTHVLSVHNGDLDMWMHTSSTGTPLSAAPIPLAQGRTLNVLYGRYTVRFDAPSIPGFKAAWLLWPADNDWAEGEIDFPEGSFDQTIGAYDHLIGDPTVNALSQDTGVRWTSGWHTATVEWTPTGVTYRLDGAVVASSRVSPRTPMHLVLQTETDPTKPVASAQGHVLVDYVSLDRWVG